MAIKSSVSLSAVLPLPPLEYDAQYMNTLIRVLNFMIQQLQNPNLLKSYELIVADRDNSTSFSINPQLQHDILTIIVKNLPTSSTGLEKGQLWIDTTAGNVLKVIP